ncbi:MAG: hypothetical protein ACTTH7_07295 [Treponema sp.]
MQIKKQCCVFIFIYVIFLAYTDTYSGMDESEAVILRAPVWVFLEPQPGTIGNEPLPKKLPPRQAITEVSRFIIAGMAYGWKFSYTPYDKKRNIAEEFTLTPIHQLQESNEPLSITELRPKYPFLYCWAEYKMTRTIAQRRQYWKSSQYITVQGTGHGKRYNETDGIYDAYTQAALSAVRTYLRKSEKNKPKCVTGELLIKDNPRLTVSSGMYTADLSLYLHVKEVIPYTVF